MKITSQLPATCPKCRSTQVGWKNEGDIVEDPGSRLLSCIDCGTLFTKRDLDAHMLSEGFNHIKANLPKTS